MLLDHTIKPDDSYFPFGFHISRKAWEHYDLKRLLRKPLSHDYHSELDAIRQLAERMSHDKQERRAPVYAGQLLAMGLVQDILRFIINYYTLDENPGSLERGVDYIATSNGPGVAEKTVGVFVTCFPPQLVELDLQSEEEFLQGKGAKQPRRMETVPEIMLLFLALSNPAMRNYSDLFEDSDLSRQVPYRRFVSRLESYFKSQPVIPELGLTLFDALQAPLQACPDSLEGQLEYMLQHWDTILPVELRRKLQLAQGILHEESLVRGFGPGSTEALRFGPGIASADDEEDYPEPERYSQDKDWMANVILLAKSTYVWLDQLSKKYQRSITRLDQVPDEELDDLSRWGFTGLWLIGLWERSSASRNIKQSMGNPDALASAYSLYDYTVAQDLGGHDAYQNLCDRARQRGIRMASDMVPNHVGIYSKWVIEHPDWFIQSEHPPFPVYSFTGQNLSQDPSIGLFIEDGYWSQQDAAVVFKRVDNNSGAVTYIYHGNDGTHMPWNDTAQLDYLQAEVREAVIQTILQVAREFPIIRFDAAMTLAKKHYQRLWFPKPGEGGAIPSRAEHGMTREEFDDHIPEEFWREVVDRVAAEVPDTLLLAEAFWLLEGYFVRTLGMHRVYNSAFMNMLKMEENSKYRTTIRNVLEFSPGILQRFVNFMNNPDEMTAVEQFGRGDKYFGVAVMMSTMPGLPMFGHGQIEGLAEKYGMEYSRAYWDEQLDEDMLRRHEDRVFPLLRRRWLFSGSENFALFDYIDSVGNVNENVFAYCNRKGGERALIVFNNSFSSTVGHIMRSTAINVGKSEQPNLVHRGLGEALELNSAENCYYIFRDYANDLEYIRSGEQLTKEGFSLQLSGYQYHAFLDFREVFDTDGVWKTLSQQLGGRGVEDIDLDYRQLMLAPVLDALADVTDRSLLRALSPAMVDEAALDEAMQMLESGIENIRNAVAGNGMAPPPVADVFERVRANIEALHLLYKETISGKENDMQQYLASRFPKDPEDCADFWRTPVLCSILNPLSAVFNMTQSEDWMENWLISMHLAQRLSEWGQEEWDAQQTVRLINALVRQEMPVEFDAELIRRACSDYNFKVFLEVNLHKDILWFNRERFECAVYWMFMLSVAGMKIPKKQREEKIQRMFKQAKGLLEAAETTSYQVEALLSALEKNNKS
jgi:glycosidase